jgi:hypothetical protein
MDADDSFLAPVFKAAPRGRVVSRTRAGLDAREPKRVDPVRSGARLVVVFRALFLIERGAVALLELLSAAAGTGIIATDLGGRGSGRAWRRH